MLDYAELLERFNGTHDLGTAEVGDAMGSLELVVTQEMVDRIAWSTDDYNPWYLDGSPFGGPIGSPLALLPFDGSLFWGHYKYPADGSLLARQDYEYLKPIFVGRKYRLEGTLVEKYRKRGRTYYTMGVAVTDEDGVLVMRSAKTCATPVTPVDGGAS